MSISEVANLRQQIDLEYQAMQNAMTGFAEGTARHAFITARLNGVGRHRQALALLIGEEAAGMLIYERYLAAIDEEISSE